MSRPLLSRRQLNLLILFLPGAILLLTLLGPDAEPAPWHSDAERRVYWQAVPVQPDYRLHLLLPQPPPESATQALRQRLLQAALRAQLHTDPLTARAQLQARPGHLRLQLTLTQAPDQALLNALLGALQPSPAIDWPALLKRVQAEQYLARQDAEGWLQGHYPTPDPDNRFDPAAAYRDWLQPAHWRLTLTGPAPQPLSLPIAADPPTPAAPPLQTRPLPVPAPTDAALTLYRWPLPAPTSAEQFALTVLAREILQQRLSAALQAPATHLHGYRLSWTPALPQGRASLILQGRPPERATDWLAALPAAAELDVARAAVQAQLRRPEQQQAWLDLIALYRLPADTLTRLPLHLQALEGAQLQRWLQPLLQSAYHHSL